MDRGQRHAPAALPLKRHDTLCTRGRVGHMAGLEGCGQSRPPQGLDPRTVQQYRLTYWRNWEQVKSRKCTIRTAMTGANRQMLFGVLNQGQWSGRRHAERSREMHTEFWRGNLRYSDNLQEQGVDGKFILR